MEVGASYGVIVFHLVCVYKGSNGVIFTRGLIVIKGETISCALKVRLFGISGHQNATTIGHGTFALQRGHSIFHCYADSQGRGVN